MPLQATQAATDRKSSAFDAIALVGEALEVARKHAAARYADVHCHVFTSESFRGVISPLMELGMVPFEIEMMGSTAPMTNEFHVLLRTV
jgi:hypothetical protein